MGVSGTARTIGALAFACLVISVDPARAPAADRVDDDALAQIKELNQSARHQIEKKNFDAARKYLLEAERRARERGGGQGRALLAPIYLDLGAVEILAATNAGLSSDYFRRALCRDPLIRPGGLISTHPEVVSLFGRMAYEYEQPKCPLPLDVREPEVPARVNALDCPFPEAVLAGTDLVIRCAANPRRRVARAMLHYRPPGADQLTAVIEMRRSERGWWTATIPAKDVAGRTSIRFYIEGLNAAGHLVVADHGRGGPHTATIVSADACHCD
jgi:hypothetical protein